MLKHSYLGILGPSGNQKIGFMTRLNEGTCLEGLADAFTSSTVGKNQDHMSAFQPSFQSSPSEVLSVFRKWELTGKKMWGLDVEVIEKRCWEVASLGGKAKWMKHH